MNKAIESKELGSAERITGFSEVVRGYTESEALAEAKRCLQCKKPLCIRGCPVGIDIKKFIYQITAGDYKGAYITIKDKNNFASICGRVCPAEYQCRRACVLTNKNEPFASKNAINIHFLERFAGDYGINNNVNVPSKKNKKFSKYRVAVVGSGPAGLCCAGELARVGFRVTIYEALHKPGGVLAYGIPPFRLPWDIVNQEIDYLKKMEVRIVTNTIISRTKTLDGLRSQYSAVFLGLGAGVPHFLNIKGENLCNVYSANEFLTRVNLMGAYKFPEFHTPVNIGKNVIVIGGGNTAIDAARVALRLQEMGGIKPHVTVAYRRTEIEMPARRLEIKHAKQEGIEFRFLTQPKEFIPDKNSCVNKITCLKSKLGEPDSSGRRKPLIIEGSDFTMDCDLAIIAVGLGANKVLTSGYKALKVDEFGDISVNAETMQTSVEGVFAGGDIVGGEGTVIEAMGMAKKAALGIKKYICK